MLSYSALKPGVKNFIFSFLISFSKQYKYIDLKMYRLKFALEHICRGA